jgi:hypothetical protein
VRLALAAECPRGHHGDGFRRRVVHDSQALQHPPFGGAIEDEVGRPDVVRSVRPGERLSVGQRHFLAATPPDL